MMGRQVEQAALFYDLRLEERVPADHLLRRVDAALDGSMKNLGRARRFGSLPGMPTASPLVRCRLKVSLRPISPMIWRRLVVPSDLTLHGLHRASQIAVGWEDYHLHAFKMHGRRYGTEWTGQRHYEPPRLSRRR